MGAVRKNCLSLITAKRTCVHVDCLIEEQDDALVTGLSAMMGKDPSWVMNEAIGELIKKYRPAGRCRAARLKLVKS